MMLTRHMMFFNAVYQLEDVVEAEQYSSDMCTSLVQRNRVPKSHSPVVAMHGNKTVMIAVGSARASICQVQSLRTYS